MLRPRFNTIDIGSLEMSRWPIFPFGPIASPANVNGEIHEKALTLKI